MNKRYVMLLGVCLIIIIGGFLFWNFESPNWLSPDKDSVIWQVAIPHFATSLAASSGKVFIDNDDADVQCFDSSNGKSLWNTSLSYANYGGGPQVKVYENKVYAGQEEGIVVRLNMETGAKELQYQAPPSDINNYKWVPTFFLADGKLFASNAGKAVFDASTGTQLWANGIHGLIVNQTARSIPESNYIYLEGSTRLNPNNGSIIWSVPNVTNFTPVVYRDKVILWNYASNFTYPQTEHAIICLDALDGKQLWRVDTDPLIFKPVVSENLILFGAQDGYFYALNLEDGSLNWKSSIDNSGLIYEYSQLQNNSTVPYSSFSISEPLIDSSNQRVYWSMLNGNMYYTSGSKSQNSGFILSLNSQNGHMEWFHTITNSSIYRTYGQPMAVLNNKLFLTGNNGVHCLQASTGNLLWERQFDHYVSNPIFADGKVFVAADLYLIAYN
jgi:outer membrane protein assembly factor BamB